MKLQDEPRAADQRWDLASLEDLILHILITFHEPLKEELPRLQELARSVLEAHGDEAPQTLPELVTVFEGLKYELEQHMAKEERILFPMIRQGNGCMADGPIAVMEQEHDSACGALVRLRALTNEYEIPEHASDAWRTLWQRLAAFDEDMQEHIRLESDLLFPRALDS